MSVQTESIPRRSERKDTFDRTWVLWLVTSGVLALLLIPVVVVTFFSFNSQKSLIVFDQASLRWYRELFGDPSMVQSLALSTEIALLSALIALTLGTMLAFGIQRGSRRAASASTGTVFLRLVTPETATGAALFLMFSQLDIPLSFWTITVGHVALSTALVTVIVRSRLANLGEDLEQAAQDLGAGRLQSLWLVVLPPMRATLVSSGLLAFVISFDNFITTYFTAGIGVQPLPLRIYSMLRFGVTPEVNAAGVVMLIFVVATILATYLVYRIVQKVQARANRREAW